MSWRKAALVAESSARFLSADTKTGGRWQGKAGAVASWMPGVREGERQDGYGLEVLRGRSHAWSYRAKNDVRVLWGSLDPEAERQATCWFSPDQVEIGVDPPNDRAYKLTVYVLDYDKNGRSCTVTAASDHRVLDSRDVSAVETDRGVYLTWQVTGPVVITVRKTAGENAIVSGVFIDSPAESIRRR
jgi:hypothetical protein